MNSLSLTEAEVTQPRHRRIHPQNSGTGQADSQRDGWEMCIYTSICS